MPNHTEASHSTADRRQAFEADARKRFQLESVPRTVPNRNERDRWRSAQGHGVTWMTVHCGVFLTQPMGLSACSNSERERIEVYPNWPCFEPFAPIGAVEIYPSLLGTTGTRVAGYPIKLEVALPRDSSRSSSRRWKCQNGFAQEAEPRQWLRRSPAPAPRRPLPQPDRLRPHACGARPR